MADETKGPPDQIPRPDPTVLTTEALHREIQALREMITREITHRAEVVDLKDNTTGEKFRSIETQFSLRDTAAEKLDVAGKTAIAAALQAQKEDAAARNESNAAAIAKSEAAFTKQIDGIGILINTMTGSFDDKLTDLKSRLDRGDGRGLGASSSNDFLAQWVPILIAIAALVFATFNRMTR